MKRDELRWSTTSARPTRAAPSPRRERTVPGLLASGTKVAAGRRWRIENDTKRFEALCDRLMERFRDEGSADAYSLLFKLNRDRFRRIVQSLVRRRDNPFEVDDVLDEVFLAIWRYPNKFRADRPNAFRNWSYGIIRNTVRNLIRARRPEPVDAELFAEVMSDDGVGYPSRVLLGREGLDSAIASWHVLLVLYRRFYEDVLNEREQRALHLVEIEEKPYKEVAAILDVTVGNLKMIICRARKKIRAGIEALIADLEEAIRLSTAA